MMIEEIELLKSISEIKRLSFEIRDCENRDERVICHSALIAFLSDIESNLAKPAPEPVAWSWLDDCSDGPGLQRRVDFYYPDFGINNGFTVQEITPLYASPPTRKELRTDPVLLSLPEIWITIRSARLNHLNKDGTTSERIAREIESAVLKANGLC